MEGQRKFWGEGGFNGRNFWGVWWVGNSLYCQRVKTIEKKIAYIGTLEIQQDKIGMNQLDRLMLF